MLSIANGVATVGAPSAFFKAGFEHRYSGAVGSLISNLAVLVNQVRVVISGEAAWGGSAMLSPPHDRASSKACGACGGINTDLTLADREWTCSCGVVMIAI